MSFKYTACLAALLMACPVACQTAWGADDWDENTNSSNNTEIFSNEAGATAAAKEYARIYIGHAKSDALEGTFSANKNTATMGKGLKAEYLYGGWADCKLATPNAKVNLVYEANNNEITLQSGSEITGDTTGGDTEYWGTPDFSIDKDSTVQFSANYNTVTVEEGAVVGDIYGGNVTLDSIWDCSNAQASALHNTVYVHSGDKSSVNDYISVTGGDAGQVNALAQYNNVVITGNGTYLVMGGAAGTEVENGKAVASDNTIAIEKECNVVLAAGGMATVEQKNGASAVTERNEVTLHNVNVTKIGSSEGE